MTERERAEERHEYEEQIAAELQRSPDYRVLRRFRPRDQYVHGYRSLDEKKVAPRAERRGLFVDVETTGLDPVTDEIIQLAILPFTFDNEPEGGERILHVELGYVGYEEPSTPISAETLSVHGITNAMVAGLRFDDGLVNSFFKEGATALVIAHQANFDRPLIEKRFPLSDVAGLPWACSLNEVDWTRDYGAVAKSLGAALAAVGEFTDDSHDALEDCRVGVHVLATATREIECARIGGVDECGQMLDASCPECGGSGVTVKTAFNDLLRSARVPTVRLWVSFPYDETGKINGRLKARKYRWNDGKNGKTKAWWRDVKPNQVTAEREWLQSVIPTVDITFTKYSARDRWSARV